MDGIESLVTEKLWPLHPLTLSPVAHQSVDEGSQDRCLSISAEFRTASGATVIPPFRLALSAVRVRSSLTGDLSPDGFRDGQGSEQRVQSRVQEQGSGQGSGFTLLATWIAQGQGAYFERTPA